MTNESHIESHLKSGHTVRDIVLGISDGLTVPFAIAAGLSGITASNTFIIAAGLAEIAAGSISMGLGGYLATKGEADHYHKEYRREVKEVKEIPESEMIEVRDILRKYTLTDTEIEPILNSFQKYPRLWIDFMMRFELGLEQPRPGQEMVSAATISGAYITGGLIPLFPYFFLKPVSAALIVSAIATLMALFAFGYIKGKFTGQAPLKSAVQTLMVGGVSAGLAFVLAKLVSS